VAEGVYPTPGGYGPFASFEGLGDVIDGVQGAALFYRISGDAVVTAGTSNTLNVRTNGGITQTAGLNNIGDGAWDFAQFNDIIVATALNNVPHYLADIDTASTFIPLPGAPSALYCERVADFLMLGNLPGNENRIQWGSANQPAGEWTPDRLTEAGFADLPREFGAVQGIVGGRYPLVFQERGISRISYVGPPTVWRAEEVEQSRGCIAPGSIVTVGFRTYFLAQDGFYATNGSEFVPIGQDRVDRWFFETVNPTRIARTHGVVDWANECIIWMFQSGTSFDKALIYSFTQDRFSLVSAPIDYLVETKVDGVTLEQLAALYPDIETIPVSLDSEQWKQQEQRLGAFSGGEYGNFTGPSVEANFETGQAKPALNKRVFVSEIRPLVDTRQTVACSAIVRGDDKNENYGPFIDVNATGYSPARMDGRDARAGLKIPAGAVWRDAQGVEVTYKVKGRR